MNKEELLAKSREENKKKDPYQMEMFQKSKRYGFIAGNIMILFHFTTRMYTNGKPDHGLWSIMAIMLGVQWFSYGKKIKDKNIITLGILWLCITAVEFVLSIIQLKNSVS